MRSIRGKRYSLFSILFVLGAVLVASIYAPSTYANQITVRSVTLIGVGTNGGSMPGVAANNKFTFTVPSVGNQSMGSVKFEYCTTASLIACATPTGLNAAGATFGGEGGSGVTGFSLGSATTNSVILTRSAATVNANTQVIVQINNVVNPTATNTTFYVRISTYTSINASTGQVDTGTVAASTANQIDFTGVMPETLVFCTGITVTANCQTVTTGVISFSQLFSPSMTNSATSEMAASTNAGQGYVITVSGATLTSGSNTIPAIGATAAASTIGTGQFGLNLMDNATPDIGAVVSPAVAGDYHGSPSANYNTADSFAFDATQPRTVAASSVPSAAQKYTVSYIVNVAGNQPPGTYTTTLTYICTPTY